MTRLGRAAFGFTPGVTGNDLSEMNASQFSTGLLGITMLLAATGCRETPDRRADQGTTGDGTSFTYAGGDGSSARVSRSRTTAGGEALHGETIVALGASAKRCVIEDVTLDARGRLERAEITVRPSCDAPAEKRLVVDPAHGEVQTTIAGNTTSRRAPTDAPWVYTPAGMGVTPVSAWVVARAAASGAEAMRSVDPALDATSLVPREQLSIATERGTTVIVGNDGADVDGSFVERVRMIDYGVTLVRVPSNAEPALACPAPNGPGGGRG